MATGADKSYVGSVNLSSSPPGCFWLKTGGGVYLNMNADGAEHPNAQQLCAGGAPAHAPVRPHALPMRRHGVTRNHACTRTLRPAIAHVGTLAPRRCGLLV